MLEMSDWRSALPHSWLLEGLPDQPGTTEKIYSFFIGHLDYILGGEQEIYLHIPEIAARDAEGSPEYPEQERWIEQVFETQRIKAREVWWSHWQFLSEDDAIAFEKFLWKCGAMRLWKLDQPSREPGILYEQFFFKITPLNRGFS
jgi:hypothetical protein